MSTNPNFVVDNTIDVSAINNNGFLFSFPNNYGSSGQVLTTNGSGTLSWVTNGSGTVTSVGMTVPAFLSVAGSPITSSGTLAVTLSGSAALPVTSGGTGQVSIASGALLLGNGASAMTTLLGPVGSVLTGGSVPSYSLTPQLGVPTSSSGSLSFARSAHNFTTTIQASSTATTSWTLTLPTDTGPALGGSLLRNVAGVTSWSSHFADRGNGLSLGTGTSNLGVNTVALGINCLGSNTASDNSSFGFESLKVNVGGGNNSSFGSKSLGLNVSGGNNSSFGAAAMNNNVVGGDNAAFGAFALNACLSSFNSALGSNSLTNVSTGTNNVGIGANAGSVITTGSNNTAINSTAFAANRSGVTAIGFGSGALASADNILVLSTGGVGKNLVVDFTIAGTAPTGLGNNLKVVIGGTTYYIPLYSSPS